MTGLSLPGTRWKARTVTRLRSTTLGEDWTEHYIHIHRTHYQLATLQLDRDYTIQVKANNSPDGDSPWRQIDTRLPVPRETLEVPVPIYNNGRMEWNSIGDAHAYFVRNLYCSGPGGISNRWEVRNYNIPSQTQDIKHIVQVRAKSNGTVY